MDIRRKILFIILTFLTAESLGCSGRQMVPIDWPNRVESAGGWQYIRQSHLDRSIWFCTNPAECTWERLGELTGLAPEEYQWWVRDMENERVFRPQPEIGTRYTVPNRVYFVMGDASLYNAFGRIPYVNYGYQWLVDYPESMLSMATRPIGFLWISRTGKAEEQGYKVISIQNAGRQEFDGIFGSSDTFGVTYFGHGNGAGLSTKEKIHSGFYSIAQIRCTQQHLLGRSMMNGCDGEAFSEQITSPTGTSKGHPGKYLPPFGGYYWE